MTKSAINVFHGVITLAFLALTTASWAQNKVVVIPMGDEDKNTVIVAKQNGDFTDPIAAMASITATAGKPYLLFIAPGVYELGSQQFVMKEYVEVAGSGQNVTILRGSVSSSSLVSGTSALVIGANNAIIRDLSIENINGASSYSVGISNDATSPTVTDVTILISSSSGREYAINNITSASTRISGSSFTLLGGISSQTGVANRNSSTSNISNSTITLSGSPNLQRGIYNQNSSSSTIYDSTIILANGTSQYGVYNNSTGFANINSSTISASTNSVRADTGSDASETYISSSILTGPVSGDPICSFTFSNLGVDLSSDCTP